MRWHATPLRTCDMHLAVPASTKAFSKAGHAGETLKTKPLVDLAPAREAQQRALAAWRKEQSVLWHAFRDTHPVEHR